MKLQELHSKIHELRSNRIMLDFDLAQLYDVETRVLKQAVRRNMERFPNDFMFQLTKEEWNKLITVCDKLPENIKYSPSQPFAFTEQGVAMLSTVLRSQKAIQVNISIIRAFVQLRQFALNYENLAKELKALEAYTNNNFTDVFKAIDFLINDKKKKEALDKRKRIGYKN